MKSTKDMIAAENEQKRNQRASIDAYIERIHTTTGLSREQIELDLLTDAVKRAQDEYDESAEYPENEDGIKGGQGHSAEELRFSTAVCGIVGCGGIMLVAVITGAMMIARYFGWMV